MRNKRGFTLVELLAVIVILGILLMIAVPTISNVINSTKEKAVKSQAMLFLDSAKKATLLNEENSEYIVYTLTDLDDDIDNERFKGIVIAKLQSEKYKYYIYLSDSTNGKIVGDIEGSNIFKLASEDLIEINDVTENENIFSDFSENVVVKIEDQTLVLNSENKSLSKYYATKSEVSIKDLGEGIVIKDYTSEVRVLLTSNQTLTKYSNISNLISSFGGQYKVEIPALNDISILSGKTTIDNSICDDNFFAQAECKNFESGLTSSVAIWISCGNGDTCYCRSNGDIINSATYCPRMAINGRIHTRGIGSASIYFSPVVTVDKSLISE